ncbi:hypothetical protein KHC33_09170 [Methanospirillum sp. J.3.6.1-F.2.7.3]|jgi:hypothetical protein|uniref:Uncharacterized protein n=2 Tax=Methanospirillum TaxID=2202 RepID=A0A8E7AZ75_9EURY|nr:MULTISPECIES: hypothetical protein [Methanospirillum]MDX8550962.1 hypothetical protein [Methanospirillum hungatei]NLW75250.1 hypothetical protein [Methanomicrobiales archaeon]QVV87543.1 hypothetical protein KHC33_09170 [Methanospirillum sp. J.3.6.1-F.2.7.3]QXO95008.1 hypothetical protein KSK55_00895 [Methanospirillum hungatei]
MNYLSVLCGKEENLPIYSQIVTCLEDITQFPDLVEPIYRDAITLNDTLLEKLRFGLLRLQLYSEIHRNSDMEEAQKMRFVSEMIERTIFGGLFIDRESFVSDSD